MPDFVLNPRLVKATFPIGDLPLCRVLLLDDSRYPWVLLVPRRPNLEEIVDMAADDRSALIEEISLVSDAMRECFRPFRLNIADIGNKAPQLHIHVVARNRDDEAWPNVVWSRPPAPFDRAESADAQRRQLADAIRNRAQFKPLTVHLDPGVDQL